MLDFVEVVIQLTPSADRERVSSWLTTRGFTVLSLRVGLLATGSRASFVRELRPSEGGATMSTELGIPKSLEGDVSAIYLNRPPEYHSGVGPRSPDSGEQTEDEE